MSRPRLAVYRHLVLPASETFVKNQVESFHRFDVELVGAQRDPALTPDVPTYVMAESGARLLASARVAAFQATRRSGALRRELERFNADVLLAHFAQDAWRIAPTAAAVGVPLVVECHGSDVLASDAYAATAERSMRQLVGHWGDLAAAATLFVASSEFVRRALVERGVPAHQVVVHHLGIPIPREPHREPRSGVLSVGRLVTNKGGDDLLQAHAAAQKLVPGLRLTFVGDGPERGTLEAKARELGTDALVTFLGVLPPGEVGALMSSHALLAVPSKPVASGASEGFGLVATEAAARELPVVAYATGGLPEAVGADGEGGGLLVPTGDVAALTDSFVRIVRDETFAAELGRLGRARAERLFDLDRCTAAVEDSLLDVVGGLR